MSGCSPSARGELIAEVIQTEAREAFKKALAVLGVSLTLVSCGGGGEALTFQIDRCGEHVLSQPGESVIATDARATITVTAQQDITGATFGVSIKDRSGVVTNQGTGRVGPMSKGDTQTLQVSFDGPAPNDGWPTMADCDVWVTGTTPA